MLASMSSAPGNTTPGDQADGRLAPAKALKFGVDTVDCAVLRVRASSWTRGVDGLAGMGRLDDGAPVARSSARHEVRWARASAPLRAAPPYAHDDEPCPRPQAAAKRARYRQLLAADQLHAAASDCTRYCSWRIARATRLCALAPTRHHPHQHRLHHRRCTAAITTITMQRRPRSTCARVHAARGLPAPHRPESRSSEIGGAAAARAALARRCCLRTDAEPSRGSLGASHRAIRTRRLTPRATMGMAAPPPGPPRTGSAGRRGARRRLGDDDPLAFIMAFI